MAKHIGIAAVSPEGAALCYRQIFRESSRVIADAADHPRLTLHNEPMALYLTALRAGDWHRVAELLARSAEALARCGAEFCFCPDNAVQHGIHLAEALSPIPWLTMPDLVGEAVARDGRGVVGLIGTKMVTMGSAYQTHLGLRGTRVLVPEDDEIELLDRIIFSELIFGEVKPGSRASVLEIIDRLAARGCEGVVLGYSEAAMLVSPEASPLPLYDSSRLLAEGAVRYATAAVV